jgi:radical SAM superfamily enzyme YgiQ (UPF0313 family)
LKERIDCLFIFSPGSEGQGNSFDYHLGSSYIICYLKSEGFHARQFINKGPVDLNGCVKEILNYNAKIAGFTVYDSNFNVSALIAEQIKKSSPGTLIVFGGPCPSVHYDFIMSRYPFVDACFINESEETFLQFISKLSEKNYKYNKTDLTGIIGISYRFTDGVFCNPENRILRDNSGTRDFLDKYPSPYLGGVIPATEGYSTGVITARGCNQNCVYCNCAVLSNRRFFTHSVDRVIEELKYISEHLEGNQVLTFQDDAFTLIPQRAREICKAIIDNKIKAHFGCITRCDCIDESLLDLMKEAGFVSIAFSLESASPLTLRRIGKVQVAEDTPSKGLQKEIRFIESLEKMTSYAKKAGIKNISASIMVGLPFETINEAKRTVEVIERNKNIDQYAHNYLAIFKGTPLFNNYEKYGYVINYINNNPIFQKIIYPVDVVSEVQISPKSNLNATRDYIDKSTLKILSLTYRENNAKSGFANIILQSNHLKGKFVKWLKEILIINGTIIQIYSDLKSMTRLADRNYEIFVKYLSPSLNLRNYCFKEDENGLFLISSDSVLLKLDKKYNNVNLCNFESVKLSLGNADVNFTRTICREANKKDSSSAYNYLSTISKRKDPFSYLVNLRALPYFANICKWTKESANCTSRNTLIVNKKSQVRLCWYGTVIGEVGQSYDELIDNFELEQNEIMLRRQCSICNAKSSCIKCSCPHPMPEEDYCKNRKSRDISEAAELIIGLDQIKQLFL